MNYEIYNLQHDLTGKLSESRFYHSMGVQAVSFALAIRYDYDCEKAGLAGLIHDCAKCMPDGQLITECEKYKLPVTEVERRNPHLLHGKLGAYYADINYGITDSEILSAITYHTTGKPGMTLLEKIIFTADYIEPNRSAARIPELNRMRKLAFENLDNAVYRILENTLNYLRSRGQEIDNLTVAAYDYYKEHCL